MEFIDEVTIEVSAGHGGPGAKSFRREKFVPFGGPDGGNGGRGGSVILRADRNCSTLLDFRYRPRWNADNGEMGSGRLKSGKDGADLYITVPIGTTVVNLSTKNVVADLTEDRQEFVIAKGGRGGKGNDFFKSATNQAPEHAQPGEAGGSGTFALSLKLVADVGVIGFPNAGKSTLLSRISSARPKIADYPFTTLTPQLGVVESKGGGSLVVADIPGLIEGAHTGKGLGIKFLKHIERTKVLLHLIDPLALDENGEPRSALESYKIINAELANFSQTLVRKPQLVAITKEDAAPKESPRALESLREAGIEARSISAVSGAGISDLIETLKKMCEAVQN